MLGLHISHTKTSQRSVRQQNTVMFVSKDEFEERLVAAFLASIDLSMAVDRLAAGSGPDFGLRQGEVVIGIELTRIYRDDRKRGMPYRQAEGVWDQVLSGAHAHWEHLGLPPVTVYVRAIPGPVPKKADIPRLVHELVSFVAARIPDENDSISYERDWAAWSTSNLPDGIAAFDIDRPSYHSTAYWLMPRSGTVPDLQPELLQKRIDVKNAKLRRYSGPPSENWLVLVVEGSGPSSTFTLAQSAIEHHYESAFHRTFLFDAFGRRTFELATVQPPEAAA